MLINNITKSNEILDTFDSGEHDLPSFQCKKCTYGFNLDWKATNLELIYSGDTVTTCTTSTYSMQSVSPYSGYDTMQGQNL